MKTKICSGGLRTLLGLGLCLTVFVWPLLALATPPPAPTGVTVSVLQGDGSVVLKWNDDAYVIRWYIYVNGVQTYTPSSSQCGYASGGLRQYVMFNLPHATATAVITMKSTYSGELSAESASVTVITGTSPGGTVYVRNDPSFPLYVTGGGGAPTTVLQGTSPWVVGVTSSVLPSGAATSANQSLVYGQMTTTSNTTSMPVRLTSVVDVNIAGGSIHVDVNGSSVVSYQGGPWTVSGSVGVSSWPAEYLGVSIQSGSVGISSWPAAYQGVSVVSSVNNVVTQGGPWTVSGSVGVSSWPAAYQGVSVVSSVNNIVTQGGPWTVSGSVAVTSLPSNYLGVSVVSSVNNVVTQGSPWTVSGSVGVSSWPAAYQGVSVVSAVNQTVLQGSPWTVSGSVAVTSLPSNYLGVSVVSSVNNIVTQGGPWTVSGSVAVTSLPSNYLGVSVVSSVNNVVTQGSPWTVSGSVGVSSWPAAYLGVSVTAALPAGTNYLGAVGITNSANLSVQGTVAAGATDSGNPVKFGGKYLATAPTLTDGQRGDAQLTSRGRIKVDALRNNYTTTATFNLNAVTYASSVFGTSYYYLTITTDSGSYLEIDNPNGGITDTTPPVLRYICYNSATAPTNMSLVYRICPAYKRSLVYLTPGCNSLHWYWVNGSTTLFTLTPTAQIYYGQ